MGRSFFTTVGSFAAGNNIQDIVTSSNPGQFNGTTYIIDNMGTYFVTGNNTFNQIGDNTTTRRTSISKTVTQQRFKIKAIAAANNSVSAIYANSPQLDLTKAGYPNTPIDPQDSLWSWGSNNFGQLGDGTTTNRASPVQAGLNRIEYQFWKMISGGAASGFGIRNSDSSLWTWGFGFLGTVNDPNRGLTYQQTPTKIGNSSWNYVSAGSSHTAAIDINGRLFTWGQNLNGQLGDGTTVEKFSPVLIGSSSWAMVSAGHSHTAAIDINGRLYTWGNGSSGQFGDGTTANRSTPVQFATPIYPTSFNLVSSGSSNNYGINMNGSLWAWGSNNVGQLGDGSTIVRLNPVQIGTSSWSMIAGSQGNAAAIDANGRLFAWGANASGQLGINLAASNRSSPVLIGTNTNWSFVSFGGDGWNAINNLGQMFATGFNTNGGVGDGTTVNRSSPVQIGVGLSWTISAAGDGQTRHAITNTGLLYGWGVGTSGGIGDGTTVSKSSPIQIGTSSWTRVAAGTNVAGAITADGRLFMWGNNDRGQLGDGTTINKSSPVQIGTSSWTAVTLKSATVFAIDINGRLFAWGFNGSGQLGDGTTVNKSSPIQIGTSSWSTVASGHDSTVGITSNGLLFAWGSASTSGDGTAAARSSPTAVRFITPTGSAFQSWNFVSTTKANFVLYAINSNGSLYASGINSSGQLGDGTTVNRSFAVQPLGLQDSSFAMVAGGESHVAAITSDKKLYVWGGNAVGQLGDNTTVAKSSPVLIATGQDPTYWKSAVATNTAGHGSYAIGQNNMLWAWGSNNFGQLGDGTTINKSSPVQIGTSSWSTVAAGGQVAAAITSDRRLFTWGQNTTGQLGDGTTINKSSPVQIGTSSWSSVAVAESHTLAISVNGLLFGWGRNSTGHLGDNTNIAKSSPVQIGSSSWSIVDTGLNHSLGITIDGRLFTWGNNAGGQLGDGTTVNKSSPVLINVVNTNNIRGWKLVSNGGYLAANLAIDNDDSSLWAWGRNNIGQLGDGTTINKSSPVQIGTSSWAIISAGTSHSAAIDINGRLFVWGSNSVGQLGDGTTINKSSPVQIGTSSWAMVSVTPNHSVAIDINGRLFAWGSNSDGQLGDGTTVNKSSPIQVGTSSWTRVTTGERYNLAIRSDGSLWGWGYNFYANLGFASAGLNYSSPVQIGTSSWSMVAAAEQYHTMGIDVTGRLFGWGYNIQGQVGNGQSGNIIQSPVQIGTSSWAMVSTGYNMTSAIDISGRLFTWGTNGSFGQLGDGTTVSQSSPVQIGTSFWKQVDATSGITLNNLLYNWGENSVGQVGDGTTVNKFAPVLILLLKLGRTQLYYPSFAQVSAGASHNLALTTTGELFTWGTNSFGQLGNNSTVIGLNPQQIGQISSWSAIGAGADHSAAITTDGKLFTWGDNGGGRLGDNTIVNKSLPVQIGNYNWSSVSGGFSHSVLVGKTGLLWTVGGNASGQLGDNTSAAKSYYVLNTRASTNKSWTFVNATNRVTYAIDDNNRALWAWGNNSNGTLGNNSIANRSTAVLIPNVKGEVGSFTAVATLTDSFLALDSGNLMAGGQNDNYQLGVYPRAPAGVLVPVAVPIESVLSIVDISAGANNKMGVSVDSSGKEYLFTWGQNDVGQLGDGTTINKSSPVMIQSGGYIGKIYSGNKTSYKK